MRSCAHLRSISTWLSGPYRAHPRKRVEKLSPCLNRSSPGARGPSQGEVARDPMEGRRASIMYWVRAALTPTDVGNIPQYLPGTRILVGRQSRRVSGPARGLFISPLTSEVVSATPEAGSCSGRDASR